MINIIYAIAVLGILGAVFGLLLAAMNLPKLNKIPSVVFIAIAAVVGMVFQMVD